MKKQQFGSNGPKVSVIGQGTWYIDRGDRKEAVAALRRGQVADAGSLPGLDHADGTVLIRRLLREAVVVPVNA